MHRLVEHARKLALITIAERCARYHDDGNLGCLRMRSKLSIHVTPTKARQGQVQHHGIGDLLLDLPQGVETVFDCDDRVSCGSQGHAVEGAKFGIVFNDQDGRLPTEGEHTAV